MNIIHNPPLPPQKKTLLHQHVSLKTRGGNLLLREGITCDSTTDLGQWVDRFMNYFSHLTC